MINQMSSQPVPRHHTSPYRQAVEEEMEADLQCPQAEEEGQEDGKVEEAMTSSEGKCRNCLPPRS